MPMTVQSDPGRDSVPTVGLTEELLSDFPKFIHMCEKSQVSGGKGVFKATLLGPDMERYTPVDVLLRQIHQTVLRESFTPIEQFFRAVSLSPNIFMYRALNVTRKSGQYAEFLRLLQTPRKFLVGSELCCHEFIEAEGDPKRKDLLKHHLEVVKSHMCEPLNLKWEPSINDIQFMLEVGSQIKCDYESHRMNAALFKRASLYGDSSQQHPWDKVIQRKQRRKVEISDSSTDSEAEEEVFKKYGLKNYRHVRRRLLNKRKLMTLKKRCKTMKTLSKGLLHGAGIVLPKFEHVYITRNFTLSRLGTILDCYYEKLPGISRPYFYVGLPHSCVPVHTEDGALWSVNFLHYGADKIWMDTVLFLVVVDPRYVWMLRDCLSVSNICLLTSRCSNLLGHKDFLIFSDFLDVHSIPYTVVIQKQGQFVFLEPNAAHFGFNCGYNIAEAVNFASESWINHGLYAPICGDVPDQIRIDMAPFLATFQPSKLQPYLQGKRFKHCDTEQVGSSMFKLQEVMQPSTGECLKIEEKALMTDGCVGAQLKPEGVKRRQRRTLKCLICGKLYFGDKVSRLLSHCEKMHASVSDIVKLTKEHYARREHKMSKSQLCFHCGKTLAGNAGNLKRHLNLVHGAGCKR